MANTKITADNIAANAITASSITDGTITAAKLAANSVDSDQYVDGSIDLIHMSANSVDSDQYVDGSIDTVHIADGAVTSAKLDTNIAIDSLVATTADVNGGTVDGTVIGGATPAAATFTTANDALGNIRSGRKNFIINGAMQVSQRGDYTTATTVANGAYSIDRWAAQLTSVTATTQHTARKQKLVATSTASGIMGSGQEIEITDTFFDNKQITISAKVTSNSTNARISFLYLGASNAWVGSASHTGGGTEETLTLTVTLPSALTRVFPTVKICDTDGVSSVNISSGDYVEFGEVQLEVGSVATEFEHRSYGEELALCQRYFQGILGGPYTWITEVQRHNSTGFRSVLHLPVPLRVVPSISYSNLAYWYNN